jgi:integrase/recombinase XerC
MGMDSLVLRESKLQVSQPLTAEGLLHSMWGSLKPTTQRAYEKDLDCFALFLSLGSKSEAVDALLSQPHGEANRTALLYQNHLREAEYSPSTINRRLSTLRSMVKLANRLGLVPWKLEVPNVKAQSYRDTAGPGTDTVAEMGQKASEDTSPKGLRDFAMLRLLWDMGLRRGEVVSLDLEHLDLEKDRIWIFGKGRNEREQVTLPARTREALEAWISARGTEAGPLFVNFDRAGKGKRLTGTSLYRVVRRLGKAVGKTARPHGIRHSSITQTLKGNNGNVLETAGFARHAKITTTQGYADNLKDSAGKLAEKLSEAF